MEDPVVAGARAPCLVPSGSEEPCWSLPTGEFHLSMSLFGKVAVLPPHSAPPLFKSPRCSLKAPATFHLLSQGPFYFGTPVIADSGL